jgi:hypothetical protein
MTAIKKLEKLFYKNNLIITTVFLNKNKQCKFLELLIPDTTQRIIVTISSSYNIKLYNHDDYDIVNLEEELYDTYKGDLIDKYVENDFIKNQNKKYKSVKDNISFKRDPENTASIFYNMIIEEGDNSGFEFSKIKRQIQRLSNCTKTTKCKLCIKTNYYFCVCNKENNIKIYKLHDNDKLHNYANIYCCISLEYLYDNIKDVSSISNSILEQIYDMLDDNFNIHIKNITSNIKNIIPVIEFDTNIRQQKSKYKQRLNDVQNTYNTLLQSEEKLLQKKLDTVNNIILKKHTKTIYRDLEITRQTKEYDNKLADINTHKKEVLRNIISLKTKYSTLSLASDAVLFDTSVMINKINQSVEYIKTYVKKINI